MKQAEHCQPKHAAIEDARNRSSGFFLIADKQNDSRPKNHRKQSSHFPFEHDVNEVSDFEIQTIEILHYGLKVTFRQGELGHGDQQNPQQRDAPKDIQSDDSLFC